MKNTVSHLIFTSLVQVLLPTELIPINTNDELKQQQYNIKISAFQKIW